MDLPKTDVMRQTAGLRHIQGPYEDIEKHLQSLKAPDAKKGGRVEVVGGPDLDFGTMRRGSRRTHKFVFKNVGESLSTYGSRLVHANAQWVSLREPS